MIDIAGKLFPNFVTVLTQLCATGVIYLMYRKFLHQPVVDYLQQRQQMMDEEIRLAEQLKQSNIEQQQQIQSQLSMSQERAEMLKEKMLQDVEKERLVMLDVASKEAASYTDKSRELMEQERQEMLGDVEEKILQAAIELNKKVLVSIPLNEKDMVSALERELKQHEA